MCRSRSRPDRFKPNFPSGSPSAGSTETFERAGELGLNLLTHLLGQTPDELAVKLDVYRSAWREAGHARLGHVTLMLHTFVGDDVDEVKEVVRAPMKQYLASAADLIKNNVSCVGPRCGRQWPPMARTPSASTISRPTTWTHSSTSRSSGTSTATPCSARPRAASRWCGWSARCSIDEISCLIDFGVDVEQAIEHLEHLDQLRHLVERDQPTHGSPLVGIDSLIREHAITHLQCTPSMARMLLADDDIADALGELETTPRGRRSTAAGPGRRAGRIRRPHV